MAAATRLTDEVLRMFRALGDESRLRLLQRRRAVTRQSLLSFRTP